MASAVLGSTLPGLWAPDGRVVSLPHASSPSSAVREEPGSPAREKALVETQGCSVLNVRATRGLFCLLEAKLQR